jgi:RNA polymerase sigma factor (sigma-70 family)
MTTAEPTILERIANGDAAAVDSCLEQYGGLVWSLVRRFIGNHADAEDAVQEIFIEIWRHAARFDASRSPESSFVATIARRRLIDRRRRSGRRLDAVAFTSEPAVTASGPSDRIEALEEAERTREFMQQLRPEQRQVLELSFQGGMSQQEIAAATNQPVGTVKTHARRGLMRLRQMLESSPDEETANRLSRK